MTKRKTVSKRGSPKSVKNAKTPAKVENVMGMGAGFTGAGSLGFPTNQGAPWSEQISQVTTGFINLRWYFVSNLRQFLSELYVEIGLVQTVVNVPVDDAFRGGIEVKSKELSDEEVEDLLTAVERDDMLGILAQGAKWARLFGGGGVVIVTDQDPESELNLDAIDSDTPLAFRAVDMWELFWDQQNTEGFNPALDEEEFEFYSYYGVKLHKSRVMKLKGIEAPSFLRPRLRGWGFSVTEALIRSLNQYLKGTDLIFEVLDEFKVDVYKIKNLVNTLMSPNGFTKVSERIRESNFRKNYQNAIVMDSEDDYDHRELSFNGIAETMDGVRMQVASDMRMPRSKLFGEAGAGLNSGSNEGDLEVYNSMVESEVRVKVKPWALKMLEIKCQQLFGFIPDDLKINFKPLRVLNALDEENMKTQKFTRALSARQAGEISKSEFRAICNRGALFDVPLDMSADALAPGADGTEDGVTDDATDPNATGGSPQDKKEIKEGVTPPADEQTSEDVNDDSEFTGKKKKNSSQYDVAAYEADGGDSQFHPKRELIFQNPGNVDEALWAKAKDASMKAFGREKWQFVTWFYKSHGGQFGSYTK